MRRAFLAAAIAALAVTGAAGPASAHSELDDSSPPDGATPRQAPDEIRLTFGEGVEQQGGGIVVKGPGGNRFDDPNSFSVSGNVASVALMPTSTSGTYTVMYRVVSEDGHPVSGDLSYELKLASASPSASEAPAPTTPSTSAAAGSDVSDVTDGTDESSNTPWVIGLIALAIVLGIALIVAMTRGGGKRQDQS